MRSYDLLVIGGGPGGVRGARWAASLGAKVGICEEKGFGGTCVLRGCIPKKLMLYGSQWREQQKLMEHYGWSSQTPQHNFEKFRNNRNQELARLSKLYQDVLHKNKVDLFCDRASFEDPHTLKVGTNKLKAQYILIATGGRPWIPPTLPGREYVLNSDQFFQLKKRPSRLIVCGSGYIGVEMASIMNGLGSQVEIVMRGKHILKGFDGKSALFLQNIMEGKGITFHTCETIEKVTKDTQGAEDHTLFLSSGKKLKADHILFATGRRPHTEGLGLQNCGVQTGPLGEILVNEQNQTSQKNIFAVGDVSNQQNLAPVALEEATLVAERLFNRSQRILNNQNIPSAVFSWPSLATVGQSEEELQKQKRPYKIYQSSFRPLKYSLSQTKQDYEKNMVRVLVCPQEDTVLGCHMVGEEAPEIIQGLALALQAGAKKSHFDQTLGLHPTAAEEFTTLRNPEN